MHPELLRDMLLPLAARLLQRATVRSTLLLVKGCLCRPHHVLLLQQVSVARYEMRRSPATATATTARPRPMSNEAEELAVTSSRGKTRGRKGRRSRPESQEELRARFAEEEARRQALAREDMMDGEEEEEIRARHLEAVAGFRLSYEDPATGLKVLTSWNHFLRGRCCGSACRHCVYGHREVPPEKRGEKVFNSAFWKPKTDTDKELKE